MGVYIRLNRYYFLSGKKDKYKERKRFIKGLIDSDLFEDISDPTLFFRGHDLMYTKEKYVSMIGFDNVFAIIEMNYRKKNFEFFEINCSINLKSSTKDIESILVKITVNKTLEKKYGHIKIEFTDVSLDFNSYFLGSAKFAIKNRINLIKCIKGLNIEKAGGTHTSLMSKINIGKDAFPFNNVKNAFYIWRNNREAAFKDIMAYRDQMRIIYNNNKARIDQLTLEEKKKLKKIKQELLKPYDLYYIPRDKLESLTLNIILRDTTLIDDFIKTKVDVEESSYQMSDPELLEPLLYELNLKINRVYKYKIPTKNFIEEKVKKGFFEVFKESEKSYYDDLMKRVKKLEEDIEDLFKNKEDYILSLDENWDNMGAKIYKLETIQRAKHFLINLFISFLDLCEIRIDLPRIQPGIDGDIDLEWKLERFRLLISIPENIEEEAGAYGDDYGDDVLKISFLPEKLNSEFLIWLRGQYHGMAN